jgi:hypothetical protein
MFGGVKSFFIKKLIDNKLGHLPPDVREKLVTVIGKNPELFKKIGEEIELRVKSGMSQQHAMMKVMELHKGELQKLMSSK